MLSLFLAFTLLVSMASLISVSAAEDVVFSDSFENGASNWKYNSSNSNEENTKISADKASDGKHSAYVIDKDDKTYGYVSNAIAAKPGYTYKVTYDQFNVEGVGGKIFVAFFDASGTRITSTSFAPKKTGAWEALSKDFTAPAGTDSMKLYITGSGKGTGESYVDNIKVTYDKDAKAEAPVTLAPSVNTAAGDTVFSESFENGLGEWSASDEKCAVVSEGKATDGKKSILVSDNSETTSPGITSPSIAINPNVKYTVSADFVDAEGIIKIYLQYFDKAGKRLTSTSTSAKQGSYTGSVAVVAPADAATAKIVIVGNSSATGKAYVDNVKLAASKEATGGEKSTGVIAEINSKIATAKPGDVIEIPDGTYSNIRINFTANGTEAAPIILKAKNPGKAVITGESTLRVTGSYLITEGLLFEKVTTKFIFVFEEATDHCQIRECMFYNCDPLDANGKIDPAGQQKWVYIRGQYNKVSNCYFRGKTALGMMAEIIRTDASPNYHLIENSYFGDYKLGSVNGLETIRIGTSSQSLSGSYSTVSGCFFESCNGEVETISVKSCNNFILNNTLYNNMGGIVLRHGNDTEVRGNLVIGGDPTSRITGVRVIGENHKVYNNYFYNTPDKSQAMYLSDGNPNPLIHEYLEVKNADVHNNTFVNVDTALVAGEYSPSASNASNRIIPPTGKIYDNAVISYKGTSPLVTGDKNAKEITFSNNYVFGKATKYDGGTPEGIKEEKFDYTIKDGFLVPSNGTGADISDVAKAPKSPYDVMPKWVKEQYYDTGKIKFNMVANDPFNKPDDKVEDLFPVEGKITVLLNGQPVSFDVEPQLINSRTMVPMRAIFEKFGAEVSWDEATATATANNVLTEIKITENSDIAYVNGKEYKLDSPAVIIDGRFLVPVRFISESFGAKVDWMDATQTVIIEYTSMAFKGEFKPMNDIEGALPFCALVQSGDDGGSNIKHTVDGSVGTKWAFKADGENNSGYGIFDLGSVKTLDKLHIAFLKSNTRIYKFSVLVSEDGVNYKAVIENKENANKDGAFEVYDLSGASARYVKFVGYGNNENTWNNLTEFVVTGK